MKTKIEPLASVTQSSQQQPAFQLDPEVEAALAALIAMGPPADHPKPGDWKLLREQGNANQDYWASLSPVFAGVETITYFATADDGTALELRWYTKMGSKAASAVVFAHGGGMILGNLDQYDGIVSEYVEQTGVPFLSVKYRLAPEVRHTTLAEDVFSGLKWLVEQTADLGVDPARIAIMGDSAGGGIAAGVAILARDHKINIAKQILIYPMLDDRNLQPDGYLVPFLTWTYDHNFTGWSALLGELLGSEQVSPVAAPARLDDFHGLAPAYIEVGELDIFRDEDINYAQHLAKAGVPTELHLHTGAPHGFERFAPSSKLALRAMADRVRVINSI